MDEKAPHESQNIHVDSVAKKPEIKFPRLNLHNTGKFLKSHWGIIAVLLIVLLATHVRLLDYRWPYLRNIDSYNFMRDMQLIVDNGGTFPGHDNLMLAPEGLYKGAGTFYPYFGAYSYMLWRALYPQTQLWQFLIWWPALVAALTAIPMYFLTKKLYDKKAGVIAALLMAFDVSIMTRTLGGDPDNDGVVLLLPLVIIATFIYVQDYLNKQGIKKKGILYSIALGLMLSVWVWTWGGYWFVIGLMLGFIVLKMMIESARLRNIKTALKHYKPHLAGFAISMLVMIAVITILVDPVFVKGLFSQLSSILHFGDIKSETGIFPNVYVSVAELQSVDSFAEIVKRIGIPFFATLIALGYLLYSYGRTKKHLDTVILLTIWFLGPIIATLVAVRFTILFATPIAIGTGILFSKIIRMTTTDEKLES